MTPQALLSPARLAGGALLRTQSDERLVDLVRAGNDRAFEAIVMRYRRPLLRYCSALMPETRAEDVVQQSLLRAYDSLRASDREMRLRPWLFRIAHNAALNALRDRGLRHEELSESIDGVERPDQAFERRQGLRDVVAAMAALPERQRDAIVLRELEGRSYEEIAAQLGVSDGAVRQLLNRARTTLRAGSSAITPTGLVMRMPWQSHGGTISERVSELCGAGVGGAVLAKLCATTLVTGAVVGGVAGVPVGGAHDGNARVAGERAANAAAHARTRTDRHEPVNTGGSHDQPERDDGSRLDSGRERADSDVDGTRHDPDGEGLGDSGGDSATEDHERSDRPDGGTSGADDDRSSDRGAGDDPAESDSGASPASGSDSSDSESLGSAAADGDASGSDAGARGESGSEAEGAGASGGGSIEPAD